ncbi:MAG: acyl-CoA dehydrogenase [Dichotomicrobium sp.]
MITLLFILVSLAALAALAIQRAPLWGWALVVAGITLLAQTGLPWGVLEPPFASIGAWIAWLPAIVLGLLSYHPLRQQVVTRPAFKTVKRILPPVSDTEKEALEAGTVGFDAEFFSGEPDWSKLRAVSAPALTDEEQKFLNETVDELCAMIDDWQLRHEQRELPEQVWRFIAEKGFFGMLISKEHGGLGFSPQAQSLVIGKIASRSPDVATVVMVPNSLGPGELIEKFGTDHQKSHYLPRLASGAEIPCFALTSPYAGSDAASMRDVGIVTKAEHDGQETLGIRLTWDKRYITLAPNATLLGLAFRLYDPDNLLGKGEELGITLALVPTDTPGVQIGQRHLPCGNAFPNGPTWGEDVFVPLDAIIGGAERAGQGWRMLMSCLSAGRAISLPATSTAAAKAMLRTSTAYGRIRKQFAIAIGRMEGIEERLARMVETAYTLEAARSVTASMVGEGAKPAVLSALMKYQSTERMRQAVSDAMDIHGGKAICDGPSNYLQAAYQMVPIGITVEGANILTRSLITFTQGVLRSHPFLYKEIEAAQHWDDDRGFEMFEDAFEQHVSFAASNVFGALFHNVTFGQFAAAPRVAETRRWYAQLSRASRNFALVADMSVALLGGGLRTRQRLTGQMADALSELYLASAVLKRYEDDGQPLADRRIVELALQNSLYRFYAALQEVTRNFPVFGVGWALRRLVFPFGFPFRPARHATGKAAVRAVLGPGEVRDRLTRDIYVSRDATDPTGILEVTLEKVIEAEPAERKVEKAIKAGMLRRSLDRDWLGEAETKGIITGEEAKLLRETEELVLKVISVDHFDPEAVTGRATRTEGAGPGLETDTPQPEQTQTNWPDYQDRVGEPADTDAAPDPNDKGGVQAAE